MSTIVARRPTKLQYPKRFPARDDMIEDHAFEVCGAMASQDSALVSIEALDEAGDMLRQGLGRLLRHIEIVSINKGYTDILEPVQAARTLLGEVDRLDEAEDGHPVVVARAHNREAAESGREIIRLVADGERAGVA